MDGQMGYDRGPQLPPFPENGRTGEVAKRDRECGSSDIPYRIRLFAYGVCIAVHYANKRIAPALEKHGVQLTHGCLAASCSAYEQ